MTAGSFLVPVLLLAASAVPREAVELSPGAFTNFAGGSAPDRPPYPDAWDPDPLSFPYAPEESLFLPPSPPEPEAAVPILPPTGTFRLPFDLKRDIRVQIQGGAASLLLSAKGGADLQWRRNDGHAQRGPSITGSARIERRGGGFRVTPAGGSSIDLPAAVALRIAPLNPDVPLEVSGKPYRGAIEFHPDGAQLQAVNALGMEDYLRGVVPLEMGRAPETSLEALKAQAVVARSYSLKRMTARGDQVFDLYASVQDQVYGGVSAEYAVSDRAVAATAGLVLTHADSVAICYYHSTCGGATASRHEVWGGAPIPYLLSSPDKDALGRPWCRASRYLDWTETWDADDLAGILRRNFAAANARGPAGFKRITGFRVRDRFADGRIDVLEVQTDRGTVELRGDKIRFGLKPGSGSGRVLESARFDIELSGGRVTAHGSGYGHGVGMCQVGALARAQAGQSFAEILAAYYPGTALAKLK